MEHITLSILKNLDREYGEVAKKKHGATKEILLGDLITAILLNETGKETAAYLGIGDQTFNRAVKRMFPGVSLKGGGQTWKSYLMALSDYKKCTPCQTLKPKSCFSKSKHGYDGLMSKCKECAKESCAKHYEENKDYYRKYAETHRSEQRARNAKRRAAELQRFIYPWEETNIALFYADCPEGYHVDHIIPLQGKLVSGLHCLDNLQYLPAKENLSKGNKFEVEEPSP